MKQTLENIAVIRLKAAAGAMDSAADLLREIGTPESKQHAAELRGAMKIMRGWQKVLRRQHRAKQRPNTEDHARRSRRVDSLVGHGGAE